jgi:hypothetical protein
VSIGKSKMGQIIQPTEKETVIYPEKKLNLLQG